MHYFMHKKIYIVLNMIKLNLVHYCWQKLKAQNCVGVYNCLKNILANIMCQNFYFYFQVL